MWAEYACCHTKLSTLVSGESFYHVLETVESSLVEPEGESVRKTTDDQGMTDTSSLRDFCLYNVFT